MQVNDKRTLLILIGGAGFIGQHIIERFNTDKNIDMFIIDKEEQIQKSNVMDITNKQHRIIPIDLTESSLINCFAKFNDDNEDMVFAEYDNICLFHLASPVGVAYHNESTFYKAMDINQNVYLFARHLKWNCGKANLSFWYTSSSEVYGNIDGKTRPKVHLETFYDINQKGGGFRSDYIYQKILGEQLFSQLGDAYTVRILRLFNIVGKYQDPTKGVFNNFINSIVNDKKCKVSKSIRCYTKVGLLLDYIGRNLTKFSDTIIIEDIVTPDYRNSLTSEELYLYLHAHINSRYPFKDGSKPTNYEVVNIPEEIEIRGIRDTISYSQFCLEFSYTIELIMMRNYLPKVGK